LFPFVAIPHRFFSRTPRVKNAAVGGFGWIKLFLRDADMNARRYDGSLLVRWMLSFVSTEKGDNMDVETIDIGRSRRIRGTGTVDFFGGGLNRAGSVFL